jgi:hypothetical protein
VEPAAPGPPGEPAARTADPSFDRPYGPHPRILATADRIAVLKRLRGAGAPSWRTLQSKCDDDVRETIPSGYEAWDWVSATLDLSLCHRVTGRAAYSRAALTYFRALLDDHVRVGDGAGGDAVIHHDDGYSIRTRGCFGAIAYDWLHDLPGMTPELRTHAVDRFVAWTDWFSESGYSHDEPIANYYFGYFGAVAFGGIAAQGDDPRASQLLRRAGRMYGSEIVPAFRSKLEGGDFPEGWQYGDLVGSLLALFTDAEARSSPSAFEAVPWLRQAPTYRTHALWPDGRHMLDTGDWSDKPAVAPSHMLLALAIVLPPPDPIARQARALARLAADPAEEWHWLAALGDDPTRPAQDPRAGALSYLARGTATLTARTDWSPRAVWVALTSAPSLSDHQHLDAGHFEMVRGGDPLVIDGGGYGSFSSLSHNVLAVDDRKENDNYAPNQATWSDTARIARYEDTPGWTYALADYASAYNPAGYPQDHPQRSVTRAEREFLFSRAPVAGMPESARLVVYDRVTLTKPTYGVTFLLHGGSPPAGAGDTLRIAAGKSAAVVTTLLPAGATPALVNEPTDLGDGPFYANEPPEDTKSVRVEIRSPLGATERRFLHAIVGGPAEGRAPAPARIEGDGADGVALQDEAYVFDRAGDQAKPAPLTYRAPAAAMRHVVVSLAPGARYDVSAAPEGGDCHVSIAPGHARAASGAGVLALEVGVGCVVK